VALSEKAPHPKKWRAGEPQPSEVEGYSPQNAIPETALILIKRALDKEILGSANSTVAAGPPRG